MRQLSKARSVISSENSALTAFEKGSVVFSNLRSFPSTSRIEEIIGEPEKLIGQELIETEKTEVGGVKFSVYSYYAKSIGYAASVAAVLFYVIYQGFSVGANLWLSRYG